MERSRRLNLLEKMVLIRRFEEELCKLIDEQKSPGVCCQMGQEACAVGVMEALAPSDLVMTNHRSSGHLMARGADPGRLLAEVMGKSTGYCKGKSGTLHVSCKDLGVYLTSTIVGAELSLVTGVGLSLSMLDKGKIVACFFGDGASCEGTFHESLNLASLWKLPVLYFCENNQWQAFVHIKEAVSIDRISKRAKAYGMPGKTVDGNDVEAVYAAAREAVEWIRGGNGPYLLEGYTYRQRGHYEPDDQRYVSTGELRKWAKKDPIEMLRKRMTKEQCITGDEYRDIEERAKARVEEAIKYAFDSPYPSPEELYSDLYA